MTVTDEGSAITDQVVYEPGDEVVYGPGIDPERLAVCLSVLEELDKLEVDHPDAIAVRRATALPSSCQNAEFSGSQRVST